VPSPSSASKIVSVTAYGANPHGSSDATPAFQDAINFAEAHGDGTVYVPPGTYLLDDPALKTSQLYIDAPIHFIGAGSRQVTLINGVGVANANVTRSVPMIELVTGPNGQPGGADGTVISGMTLNSSKYEAGTDIMDFANDTTLEDLSVDAAKSTNTYNPNSFGIRLLAICNPSNFATIHRVDNTVRNVTITGDGSMGQTELDVSCQVNASLNNISVTGNGMDSYISKNVTVDNAHLVGHASVGKAYTWVINDSTNVVLDNITTVGSGGVIVQHRDNEPATNITVENEVMNEPSASLFIGDVNGLLLKDDHLANIHINPWVSASGISTSDTTISGSVLCQHVDLIHKLNGLSCKATS
jgi:hypothetical protein